MLSPGVDRGAARHPRTREREMTAIALVQKGTAGDGGDDGGGYLHDDDNDDDDNDCDHDDDDDDDDDDDVATLIF